jgi:hypothetical protein
MTKARDIRDAEVSVKPQKAAGTQAKTKSQATKGLSTKTGPRKQAPEPSQKTGRLKGAARGARPASLKTVGKSTAAKKGSRQKEKTR